MVCAEEACLNKNKTALNRLLVGVLKAAFFLLFLFAGILEPAIAAGKCGSTYDKTLYSVTAKHLKVDGRKKESVFSGAVKFRSGKNLMVSEFLRVNENTGAVLARNKVRYTSCLTSPPIWFLSADKAVLNIRKDKLKLYKPTLNIGGLRVFFLPFLNLSLDDKRSSGFLFPEIDYSSKRGAEVRIPYYFNLAPNLDFLFNPAYMSKRGLQFAGKFRYLFPMAEGSLQSEWINDSSYGAKRYEYRWQHASRINDDLGFFVDTRRVSDEDYVQDYFSDRSLLYEGYLPSSANLRYFWKGWNLKLSSERLQRTHALYLPAGDIFQKRPDLQLYGSHFFSNLGLQTQTLLRWTDFHRPSADSISVKRLYAKLEIKKSFRASWGHITPAFGFYNVNYDAEDDNNASLSVPVISLRGALNFEKAFAGKNFQAVLRPEFMYLYVPRKRQADLPILDTAFKILSYDNLFAANYFSGGDRVGNANQLTLGVVGRVVERKSGRNLMRARIGFINYFQDREIEFDSLFVDKRKISNVVVDLRFNLTEELSLRSEAHFGERHFNPVGTRHVLPVGTRHALLFSAKNKARFALYYSSLKIQDTERDEMSGRIVISDAIFNSRQARAVFDAPLSYKWKIYGTWSRELSNGKDIELSVGMNYESCCWSMSFFARRYLVDIVGANPTFSQGILDYDNVLGIRFSIHDLGAIGKSAENAINKYFL